MEPEREICRWCGYSNVFPCLREDEKNRCPHVERADKRQAILSKVARDQDRRRRAAALLTQKEIGEILKREKKKGRTKAALPSSIKGW